MSVQKSHSSKKFQSNLEVHTKSKLINSLINKKLLQEKEFVRDRFVKIVKGVQNRKLQCQEVRPSSGSKFKVRKRANSLKNVNVSMQKIKQSLVFNSLKPSLSQQAQFIISRQHISPLLTPQQIQQVVSARNNSHLIQIKLSQKDKKGYQYIPFLESFNKEGYQNILHTDRIQSGLNNNLIKRIQQELDNQLWLPGLPHTEMLLENMQQAGQLLKISYHNNLNDLLVVKSPTFTAHGNIFTPIKTSTPSKITSSQSILQTTKLLNSTKLLDSVHMQQKQEIIYDFKKYNNNDFLALQKWFQKSISAAHQKYSQNQSQYNNSKHLLNLLYSIHIGGFQQLMRLHYIQAWQKALVFEKMFWSLIRLFGSLMEEQHKINFFQYKVFQRELKQQRELYEKRCEKLEHNMYAAQQQSSSTQLINKRLTLAYITYSRVNSRLCEQLQHMNNAHTQLQRQFDYINHRLMKLIGILNTNNQLKTIADQVHTTYYLIHNDNEKLAEIITIRTDPEESARIAKNKLQLEVQQTIKKQFNYLHQVTQKDRQLIQKDILAKKAISEQKIQQIHQQPVFSTRVGERISQVQHQLNKYWLNKQQSLHMNAIINKQLLNYSTAQAGTSTYEKYTTCQFATQYPEHQQRSFAEFLKQQLQKQKSNHQKDIKQQQDLYVSLKELYEQSYQKIRNLQNKNHHLTNELEANLIIINQKDKKIQQLTQQLHTNQSQLQAKLQIISQLTKDKVTLQQKIIQQQLSIDILQQRLHNDNENSQNLNRTNLQLKEKLEKITFKLKQAESKLILSHDQKQQIQIQLSHSQSLKKQFEDKHKNLHQKLQKLAPYVDRFLDFKRYDVESIIITNLKNELQRHFSEYFCKDSDLFLTKE